MIKLINLKNKKGITLIALVITIIVLLILAGVSISMLSGDNSILQKATYAKTKTDEAQIRERIQLAYHSALTKDITGENGELTMPTLQTELNNEFTGKTVTIIPSADNKEWIIEVDSVKVSVVAGKSITQAGEKDKNGLEIATTRETTPFLPDPTNNEITNNDFSTGLTIKDSNQNEWVWIVVPKTATVYKTAGVGKTLPEIPDNSENSIYTKIEEDLRIYCETDKEGHTLIARQAGGTDYQTTTAGFIDEYEGTAPKGSVITNANKYKEYKQKMLKSVYENGGFYIGKYETGYEGTTKRGSAGATTQTAVIKQNAYPYNYVTNTQAEDLAEGLKTGEKTTTLLFGVQWDLALRHLSELGVSTSDLTGNSPNWGNCYSQPFTINRGEYSQVNPWSNFLLYTTATANKVTVTGSGENLISRKVGTTNTNRILLTTGASDTNSKKNIYDLAGNVYEWTLEKSSVTGAACCLRGGALNNDQSASCRMSSRPDENAFNSGFRVTLY